MDIMIIADFCGDLSKKENGRFQYLAEWLSADNEVELVTGNYNHGAKKHFGKLAFEYKYRITMLEEKAYKKNICLGRLKSHYVLGRTLKEYLNSRKKPDVIYCAMPPLNLAAEAGRYCKRNNIKFIVDIQDLWPEAFQMVFHVPVLSNLAFLPMKALADRAFSCADVICGVSDTYVKRGLKANEKAKGLTVFLGTDMGQFEYNKENAAIEISKPEGELWLGYCGSLSDSYDIKCVVDALELVKNKGYDSVKFMVMGDGYKKEEYHAYADEKQIKNYFYGFLPYDKMCKVLSVCDIVVNPIVKGSAASIINKHGDYAAAGIPVLNTQESLEYVNLVNEYQMGLNCKCGDCLDLAEKMIMLLKNEELRVEMGNNALKCARDKFDRKNSYKDIINEILK